MAGSGISHFFASGQIPGPAIKKSRDPGRGCTVSSMQALRSSPTSAPRRPALAVSLLLHC